MYSIDILIQDRQLIHQAVADLSQEQLLRIPPGFDNNIAWNLGHIIVVQQLLHYKLSRLEMSVTREQAKMYRTGTSPADWPEEPDVTRLLPLLDETARRLAEDYENGRFTRYRTYTTSTGISLANIEAAIAFNNFHEGLHLGFILALRNLVIDSGKKQISQTATEAP